MNAFVRGIWGDSLIERHAKVLADVKKSLRFQIPDPPLTIYVFGKDNYDYLKSLGFAPEQLRLLNQKGVVNFGSSRKRTQDQAGHVVYGCSQWRHKLEILRAALDEFSAVAWLDWDCRLKNPLPDDWWEQKLEGAAFQSALTLYVRPKCPWRFVPGHEDDDMLFPWEPLPAAVRTVPCGSFIYCRDKSIAQELLDLQAKHPQEYDEQVYARWTDKQLGGWKGAAGYVEAGFQPLDVWVHRPLFIPENLVWYAPRRIRRHDLRSA